MLLEIENVSASYGGIQAISGVSLTLDEGELVALIGANGAGKTTTIRVISGLQEADSGSIRLNGDEITQLSSAKRVRKGICQSPEGRLVFAKLTVDENLSMGAYTRRDGAMEEDRARIFALFPVLKERRDQAAGLLSGGQQQMLSIGRALMARPRILLLDEPSMGLAPVLVREILDKIVELRDKEGATILLVEQNARAALAISDRAYVLETGRVVTSGPAAELMNDPAVRAAYLGV